MSISEYRGRPIQQYLDFEYDPTAEYRKECYTGNIVRSAKPHDCFVPITGGFRNAVPIGTLMLVERALIDGEFCTVRTTLDDIDDYLKDEEAGL